MPSFTHIEDKAHLDHILQTAKNSANGPAVVVIDFYATWCQPCAEIAPIFNELSTKYTNMRFVKVDIDKNEDVAELYNIRTLPTFIFMRGTDQVDRIQGAIPHILKAKVQELACSNEDTNETESHKSTQSSKLHDLSILVSKPHCECLNEDDSHCLSNLLNSEDGKAYLLSDTDEQLIIFVTFAQFVRLQAIQITGPVENGPKTVKLFINQLTTPNFDACEAGEPVQSFDLTEKDMRDDEIIQLNFVKFQNVNTITIFVKNNQTSAEQTRIDKLRFYGYPVNTTNMNEFKRISGKKGEAHE